MPNKIKLTDAIVANATLPAGKSDFTVWDDGVPGFGLRIRPGGKTWILAYRPAGAGRSANSKRMKLGTPETVKTAADARNLARIALGKIASGGDPLAERKEVRRREKVRVDGLLDRYDKALAKRGYVNRKTVINGLKARLRHLAARDIREITGAELVTIIETLEKSGQPGAAEDFRSRCRAFLTWCMTRAKVLDHNPLSGFRKERATRADRLAKGNIGRALSDDELVKILLAADSATVLGRLVRFLILTGCRRGEGAGLSRSMINRQHDKIELPPAFVKQGRGHVVPITEPLGELLDQCPVDARSDLVFPSPRTGGPIKGWTKHVAGLQKASGVDFTLHDLRRTFRTGLSKLGISPDTAELALGHAREDLEAIYNRDGADLAIRKAFEAWANHVDQAVKKERDRRSGVFG